VPIVGVARVLLPDIRKRDIALDADHEARFEDAIVAGLEAAEVAAHARKQIIWTEQIKRAGQIASHAAREAGIDPFMTSFVHRSRSEDVVPEGATLGSERSGEPTCPISYSITSSAVGGRRELSSSAGRIFRMVLSLPNAKPMRL